MQDQQAPLQNHLTEPQKGSIPSSEVDVLTQATESVKECVVRTVANPHARSEEIAKIRAAYIKAKFGVDPV